MRIIIHRGSHEIGGSCVEIMARDTRIIHDGPELVKAGVLPGIKGFYEWDTANKAVDAFFLSHAHLDQYGFLKFKKKAIPCYMGESRLIQDRKGAGQSYTKV
jgi:ribonuclease J